MAPIPAVYLIAYPKPASNPSHGAGASEAHSRPQPADRDVWALIAVMCAGRGHAPEAVRAIDAALALDPGNAGLRMFRQNLVARAGH